MGRAIEMLFYAVIVVLVIGGALYLLARYSNEHARGATPDATTPAAQPHAGSGLQ